MDYFNHFDFWKAFLFRRTIHKGILTLYLKGIILMEILSKKPLRNMIYPLTYRSFISCDNHIYPSYSFEASFNYFHTENNEQLYISVSKGDNYSLYLIPYSILTYKANTITLMRNIYSKCSGHWYDIHLSTCLSMEIVIFK